MLSKETKELERVLRTGNIKEIKHVFGKSSEPLQQKDVVKVLRLLNNGGTFLYLFHIKLHMPDYPDRSPAR